MCIVPPRFSMAIPDTPPIFSFRKARTAYNDRDYKFYATILSFLTVISFQLEIEPI